MAGTWWRRGSAPNRSTEVTVLWEGDAKGKRKTLGNLRK